jgi:hypothetical protein
MLPVKPVLEIHPAHRNPVRVPLGKPPSSSFSVPSSPKISELKARYEALHANVYPLDVKKVVSS